MKRIVFSFFLLCTFSGYTQSQSHPLVILDSKNMGYMDLKLIDPKDMLIYVYKGNAAEILKKFDTNSGVVIFASKRFILDAFYKSNIENSPLKKEIPNSEYLSKMGIIGSKAESKYLPYDELSKYINISTIKGDEKKIASITFIKATDSQKINPEWEFGALEITSTTEE